MKYGALSYLMTREEVRQALLPVVQSTLENEFLLVKMGHGVMFELRVGKQFGMADPILLQAYAAIADWLDVERGLIIPANTVEELRELIELRPDGKVGARVVPKEALFDPWVRKTFPDYQGRHVEMWLQRGPQEAQETKENTSQCPHRIHPIFPF